MTSQDRALSPKASAPGSQPGGASAAGVAGAVAGDEARRRRARRDRHGRGPRTPLMPPELPGFRTRAELFDQLVMDAVAELEGRWPEQIASIEFAVDDVPALPSGAVVTSSDVVVDDGVPLARFFPPGVDGRGRATKARVVVYRRPMELRAPSSSELVELVTDVLSEQLEAVLGDGQA